MSQHKAVWFEIPARNFERARDFYQTVFQTELREETMGEARMGVFAAEKTAVHGCIVTGAGLQPSAAGTVVYLNGGRDLATPLAKVEAAGGKVVIPKTLISKEIGYFAQFVDTEGNRVG